jgi:hypothetical protein
MSYFSLFHFQKDKRKKAGLVVPSMSYGIMAMNTRKF